jgi:putative ABC transport system ATP-binding protein
MGEEIMQLFQKINDEKKITIVQVTHSEYSASFGKSIIYVKDGMIDGGYDE